MIHRVLTHARGTLSASANSGEDDTNPSDSDDSSDDSESSDSDDSSEETLRDTSKSHFK